MSQVGPNRPTYGGWVRPRSPGIGRLGLIPSLIAGGGLILALLSLLVTGPLVAMSVLAVAVAAAGLTIRPAIGPSVGAAIVTRVAWWRTRSRRAHQFRGGAFARNGSGAMRLPGVAASTTTMTGHSGHGERFGVVVRRTSNLYTVVFRCRADGDALVDTDIVDQWVAGWGSSLVMFAHEPGLAGVTVIVDTAPDPGTLLAAEVHGNADPHAPELARSVMSTIVDTFPRGSSENTAYVALSYSAVGVSRRSRKPEDLIVEIGRRVQSVIDALGFAGAGTVEPLTEHELAEVVRVAYDPACAVDLAEARSETQETDLTWAEAGPHAAQESWDSYRHDSGRSITWAMTTPASGAVHSDVLTPLLAPHSDFVRKRVAVIYRPHGPEQARRIAETDVQTALFTAQTKGRVTASANARARATQRAADEVADGAQMTRFAVMVTVTVDAEDDLAQAATTAENLAATSRLRLRRCYGTQAAAFAATLPLGFLPWRHTTVPDSIRENL